MITALSAFSGITVNNLAEARRFYVDTLALKVVSEEMGLLVELPGGGQTFFYEKADHKPAPYTYLNFVVENIDETVEHLKGHGIVFEHYDNLPAKQDDKEILRGLAMNYGPDIAWFKDPAGNTLAVLQQK